MLKYFASLSPGKAVLWCYLLWYVVILAFYFDPTPRIWLNSLGISVVIGFALMLSVSNGPATKMERWQMFRLFAMPFCVSSFSSLIKNKDFMLIFPPQPVQLITAIEVCLLFVAAVAALQSFQSRQGAVVRKPVLLNY